MQLSALSSEIDIVCAQLSKNSMKVVEIVSLESL